MKSNCRDYSFWDQIILHGQAALGTVASQRSPRRENPAKKDAEPTLTPAEKQHSIGLMRVNHTGEVCAQALYRGQMLTAQASAVRAVLTIAAEEETDHLSWCEERLHELGGHTSYLNLFWYVNSFLIGALAGLSGDATSLGFVEETEKQVEAHLASHLNRLPAHDTKSRKIVEHMQHDEIRHGEKAKQTGAAELPSVVKKLMTSHAKVMTTLGYWI